MGPHHRRRVVGGAVRAVQHAGWAQRRLPAWVVVLMALTVADANRINTVLRWLVGRPRTWVPSPGAMDDVRDAAVALAERSYRILSAGMRGDDVRRAWPGADGVPELVLAETRDTVVRMLDLDAEGLASLPWRIRTELAERVARELAERGLLVGRHDNGEPPITRLSGGRVAVELDPECRYLDEGEGLPWFVLPRYALCTAEPSGANPQPGYWASDDEIDEDAEWRAAAPVPARVEQAGAPR